MPRFPATAEATTETSGAPRPPTARRARLATRRRGCAPRAATAGFRATAVAAAATGHARRGTRATIAAPSGVPVRRAHCRRPRARRVPASRRVVATRRAVLASAASPGAVPPDSATRRRVVRRELAKTAHRRCPGTCASTGVAGAEWRPTALRTWRATRARGSARRCASTPGPRGATAAAAAPRIPRPGRSCASRVGWPPRAATTATSASSAPGTVGLSTVVLGARVQPAGATGTTNPLRIRTARTRWRRAPRWARPPTARPTKAAPASSSERPGFREGDLGVHPRKR
jgi:hypothetical protein